MARPVGERIAAISICANAFVVGAVIMGFEMLGSRYLYPFFGGGIGTWAGLISTVLCALAIGYFAGGVIVDFYPSPRLVAASFAVAAIYLALVPGNANPVLFWILRDIGDGPWAILLAAVLLLLLPLTLLGTFSPIAIRLLIRSMHRSGRIAGAVYGISTVGSVLGTLVTTFVLIPTIGSREITYVFAGVLALCTASLFFTPKGGD
jgi:predicted membrane-bound spermidine synthase